MTKLGNIHQAIVDQLEVGRTDEGHAFVFNIKKNPIAELFIAMLKKALNGSKYSIRVRGSQADRKGKREQGFHVTDSNVPLIHADRYRIYIDGIETAKDNSELQTKANYFEKEYRSSREALLLSLSNTAKARERIESISGELKNAGLNSSRLLLDINELTCENTKLKNRIIELTAAINKKERPSFAIATSSPTGQEYVQLLAFRRGFAWNDNMYNHSQQVRTNIGKMLYFLFEDGKYNMFHADSIEDVKDGTTIFDTLVKGDIEAFAVMLNDAASTLITQEEKMMMASGRNLEAVKHIKDRTGLGLREAKAIYDAYKSQA